MNILIITTGTRPELLQQTFESLSGNATDPQSHHWTIVMDGESEIFRARQPLVSCLDYADTLIVNTDRIGASASRNTGASSIPRYRRQKYVMFLDDDVYMCPKWDERLLELVQYCDKSIISGHAHPFNQMEGRLARPVNTPIEHSLHYGVPLVISSVHMLMPWELWDNIGYFVEPGGPGGSEDYDYSMRAKAKGYGFAVTEPQCVIHCGLTSSSGKPIVGAELVADNNAKLERIHGIEGKVRYG